MGGVIPVSDLFDVSSELNVTDAAPCTNGRFGEVLRRLLWRGVNLVTEEWNDEILFFGWICNGCAHADGTDARECLLR